MKRLLALLTFQSCSVVSSSLYEEKYYKYHYKDTSLPEVDASSLANLGEEMVKWSRDSLPYDVINRLIRSNGDNISTFVSETLSFEAPYLVISVCMLASVILPLYTLFLCCCAKKKVIGECEARSRGRTSKKITSSVLFIVAVLLLANGSSLFSSLQHMHASINVSKSHILNSLDNVNTFTDTSLEAYRTVLEDDFEKTVDQIHHEIQSLPEKLGYSIGEIFLKELLPFDDSIDLLYKACTKHLLSVDLLAVHRSMLLDFQQESQLELQHIDTLLKSWYSHCPEEHSNVSCQFADLAEEMSLQYNLTNDLLLHDASITVKEFVSQRALERYLNETEKEMTSLGDFIRILDNDRTIRNHTTTTEQFNNATFQKLRTAANGIKETTLWIKEETIGVFSHPLFFYSEWVLKSPPFVCFLTACCIFVALACAWTGERLADPNHLDELNSPMKLARLAKDLLNSSYLLLFMLTPLFATLMTSCLLVGANLSLLCSGLHDGSIFKQVIDNRDNWGTTLPLEKLLQSNNSVRIEEVLNRCALKQSAWQALLGEIFSFPHEDRQLDVSQLVDVSLLNNKTYLKKSPSTITTMLLPNASNVSNFTVSPVNEKNTGVNFDFEQLADGLHFVIASFEPNSSFYENSTELLDALLHFEAHHLHEINAAALQYKIDEKTLNEQIANISNLSDETESAYRKVFEFFQSNKTTKINIEVISNVSVTSWIKEYNLLAQHQISERIGDCWIFWKIYFDSKTIVCQSFAPASNATWVGLTLILVWLLLGYPFSRKLSQRLSITALDFQPQTNAGQQTVTPNKPTAIFRKLLRRK